MPHAKIKLYSRRDILLYKHIASSSFGKILFCLFLAGLFLSTVIKIINSLVSYICGEGNIFSSFVDAFFFNMPSYGTLATMVNMFVGLIFSVALILENKKKELIYIENSIDKAISRFRGDDNFRNRVIFNVIDNLEKDIVNDTNVIKYGIKIFITISIFPPTFGCTLLFSWDVEPSGSEKYSVFLLMCFFIIFSSAISILYIKNLAYAFQRQIFIYGNYLKNREKIKKLSEKIYLESDLEGRVDEI